MLPARGPCWRPRCAPGAAGATALPEQPALGGGAMPQGTARTGLLRRGLVLWGARGPAVPQGRVLRPQLPLHSRPAVSRSQPGVWLSAARAALPLTLPFPPQPPGRAASTSVARCPQVPPALCAPLCPRGPAGGCTFVMRPRGSPGGDARGSARAPWVPVGQWVQREPTPEPCLWGPQCRTHGRRGLRSHWWCGAGGSVAVG